jgi:mannosyltransferase
VETPSRSPSPPSARRDAWILAFVALGCVLRLTGLDVHSLWFDEGGTLAIAKSADVAEALRLDRHPPLSALAVRAWIAAFGEGDAALRSLPALASCATLVLFASWARDWVRGGAASLAAVALFAVAPFQVWHGQELRMYPLVQLGAMAALWGVERAARGRIALGAAFAFLGAAYATGNHYLGAWTAPAVLAIALARGGELGRRRAALLGGASIAGALAWAPWILSYAPSQQADNAWTRLGHHDLRALLEAPIRQVLAALSAVPPRWTWAVYAVGAALALGWTSLLARIARRREPRDIALALAAAAPILLSFAADAAFHIGFLPKYAIVAAPAVTLAAAVGLVALRPAPLGRALVAAVAVACVTLTLWLRTENAYEDYRGACAEVRASWRPGDRILVISGAPEPFCCATVRHYLRDDPELLAALVPPDELTTAITELRANGGRLHVVHRGDEGEPPYGEIESSLARLERRPRRIHIESSLWSATRPPATPTR